MTTTVIIQAHPAAPNTAVDVTLTRHDNELDNDYFVLADGASLTLNLVDGEELSIQESATKVIPAT